MNLNYTYKNKNQTIKSAIKSLWNKKYILIQVLFIYFFWIHLSWAKKWKKRNEFHRFNRLNCVKAENLTTWERSHTFDRFPVVTPFDGFVYFIYFSFTFSSKLKAIWCGNQENSRVKDVSSKLTKNLCHNFETQRKMQEGKKTERKDAYFPFSILFNSL